MKAREEEVADGILGIGRRVDVCADGVIFVSLDLDVEVRDAFLARRVVEDPAAEACRLDAEFRERLKHGVGLHARAVGDVEECLRTGKKNSGRT